MKLREYQSDFIKYWENVLPYGVMLWDRQSGKTSSAIYEVCRLSIATKNLNSFMYFHGPLLAYAKGDIVKIFRDIGQSHLIKQENAQLIRLTNGSNIRLFNLRSEKTLAGNNVDIIYIDEFDFMKDNVFEEFLMYSALKPHVKVILSSSNYNNRKMKILREYKGYNEYFIHRHTT